MEKLHYIREIMALKGVTGINLAKELGVSQPTISSFLSRDIRISTAAQIAKALNVPLKQLFTDPNESGIDEMASSISTTKATELICPKCGEKLTAEIKLKS